MAHGGTGGDVIGRGNRRATGQGLSSFEGNDSARIGNKVERAIAVIPIPRTRTSRLAPGIVHGTGILGKIADGIVVVEGCQRDLFAGRIVGDIEILRAPAAIDKLVADRLAACDIGIGKAIAHTHGPRGGNKSQRRAEVGIAGPPFVAGQRIERKIGGSGSVSSNRESAGNTQLADLG